MTGRLQPPPQDLLLSGMRFNIETYSMFSHGQSLEKGMNFSRAMAPLGEFPKFRPDILDNIDFNGLLRASLANYGLSDILLDEAAVDAIRQAKAQQEAAMRGGGRQMPSGAEKGREKGIENTVRRETEASGMDDSQIEGAGV